MVRIAPIRLAYNPKTLWFDPGDLELKKEDPVVVSTARGLEFGRMADDVFEADEAQVKKLKTALKPVKRLASEEDVARAEEMCRRSEEALPVFKQMAAEASEDMHPVSVEFLLDGDKAVFYFEAEERVDFRELVRRLAAHFHARIDMRQIGVRDEARMVGGLGHCGQELCCKRLGGEFCPVSIRMAKEQDLSLNPQKISGVCGRLMCCLRYEFDAYKDFKSRAPKQNSQVETPAGMAKVVDLDVPREIVSLKVEGEKPVRVPLADFEPPDEGSNRPNRVGQDAWNEATTQAVIGVAGESSIFATSQLTGSDKLADPKAVRRTGSGGKGGPKGRGGAGKGSGTGSGGSSAGSGNESRKPRRRRSTKVAADGTVQPATTEETPSKRKPKQGGAAASGGGRKQGSKKGGNGAQGGGNGGKKGSGSQNGQGRNGGAPTGGGRGGADKNAKKQGTKGGQGASKQGPRPGQRSSGLRQQGAGASASGAPGAAPGGEGGHRRARRRSHKAGGPQEGQGGAAGGKAE
ncbi:MAG: hypothetical protein KH158_09305 [Eggerthellaceae bacterium]|uniref:PSP1 domain-containing protein n=1 Tax=Gordonibacter sp. RACS_AR68 TaxID=2872005 RepID=UPI001D278C6E|nr:regulatory iron-sulfur-containing complex subunit RicT [Gordonibacter sp. RACS_AR68]MBS6975856.1 hypothetical protein [Eggerthellaceae bacterium]MDN4469549.1 hypothetical protein [Gordonibacter sp. RACS_AR68]